MINKSLPSRGYNLMRVHMDVYIANQNSTDKILMMASLVYNMYLWHFVDLSAFMTAEVTRGVELFKQEKKVAVIPSFYFTGGCLLNHVASCFHVSVK